MRLARSRRPRPSGVAEGLPIPAPVGGWDDISSLAEMPVNRAYQLDNWVPKPGWIEPRRGYVPQCTGLGLANTPVQTVMAYCGAGTVNKLFAVAAGALYDCTLRGAAVDTTVRFAKSRIQHIMFSNPSAAVDYLIAVSGGDKPKAFNGSTWIELAITGAGFDPATFIHVASHKGRLWFVPDQSTGVVYLDTVGGIQGSAHLFPLGQLMSKGGSIVAVGTWTTDTGELLDEYIAFVTSRGQVIVYQGTDPSTAGTWSLVGRYDIGAPIGHRCLLKLAGNLMIVTIDGIVPMTELIENRTDRTAENRSLPSSVIMNPITEAAKLYRQNFGWSMTAYAKGTLLILNIPIAENYRQMQFAMNTITGAWCRFFDKDLGRGVPANCWEVDTNDNIFFGGNDGTVYQYDLGASDDGEPITCLVKTAYNGFGNAAQLKRCTMMQPLITTTGNPIPSIGLNIDFDDDADLSTEQPISSGFPKWGQVKWGGFKWPVRKTSQNDWISVSGKGHYVSVVTMITTRSSESNPEAPVLLQLNGWNLLAERGAFV